jgi:hypothetical protein
MGLRSVMVNDQNEGNFWEIDMSDETIKDIFRVVNENRQDQARILQILDGVRTDQTTMMQDMRHMTSRMQRLEQTLEAQEGVLNSVLERLDRIVDEVRRSPVR